MANTIRNFKPDEIKPGGFYWVGMANQSQRNSECLFQAKKVILPPEWSTASEKRQKQLMKDMEVEGTWYWLLEETAVGTRLVSLAALDGKQERDEGDNRKFVELPEGADRSRVFQDKGGSWDDTIQLDAITREAHVVLGPRPADLPEGALYCDMCYDKRFKRFEHLPLPTTPPAPSTPPLAAPPPAAASLTTPAASTSTTGPEIQRTASVLFNPPNAPATRLPRSLFGSRPPGPGGPNHRVQHRPIVPYLSATNSTPSADALASSHGHRAPDPVLRQFLPSTNANTATSSETDSGSGRDGVLHVVHMCCGGGGACFQAPVTGGNTTQVVTRWCIDIRLDAVLTASANAGDSALPYIMHAEELYCYVVWSHNLLAWLDTVVTEDMEAEVENRHYVLGGARRRQGNAAADEEEEEEEEEWGETENEEEEGEDGDRDDNDDDEEEDSEDTNDDDSSDGQEWEVKDILSYRLCHAVGVRHGKDGQLARRLTPADCWLEFLVEWNYDPVRHKGSWPEYPKGLYQWVQLRHMSSFKLLRAFMVRVMRVEGLLPMRGMRLMLVGGPPCQGLCGYNRHRLTGGGCGQSLMDQPKNRVIMALMELGVFLQVEYHLFEQIPEGAILEDGIWERTVLGHALASGYQASVQLIHASDQGAPQVRARMFIWLTAPGRPLPPAPAPEFRHVIELPAQPQSRKLMRRTVTALEECVPEAESGAELRPPQTWLDATSNLEWRSNYSVSPVARAGCPAFPLQRVLQQHPPPGRPSADLSFAMYLGNCAPVMLDWAAKLVVLFEAHYEVHLQRRQQQLQRRQQRRRRGAASGSQSVGAGEVTRGGVAPRAAKKAAAAAMAAMGAGNAVDEMSAERWAEHAAYASVGKVLAELTTKSDKAASGQTESEEAEPGAGPRKRRRAQEADLLASQTAHGKKAVQSAYEALRRALPLTPHLLSLLRSELARVEGPHTNPHTETDSPGPSGPRDPHPGSHSASEESGAGPLRRPPPGAVGPSSGHTATRGPHRGDRCTGVGIRTRNGAEGRDGGGVTAGVAAAGAVAGQDAVGPGPSGGIGGSGKGRDEGSGAAGVAGAGGGTSRQYGGQGARTAPGDGGERLSQRREGEAVAPQPLGRVRSADEASERTAAVPAVDGRATAGRRVAPAAPAEAAGGCLVANHVPYMLGMADVERVERVPVGVPGGASLLDVKGVETALLPCGERVLTPGLAACAKRLKTAASDGAGGSGGGPSAPRPGRVYGRIWSRLPETSACGTVCGPSRVTDPQKGPCLHYRQHRLATPREWACAQGWALHRVLLTAVAPHCAHLRRHPGLLTRTEAIIKPAIKGLEWLLRVGPAVLNPAALAESRDVQGGGTSAVHDDDDARNIRYEVLTLKAGTSDGGGDGDGGKDAGTESLPECDLGQLRKVLWRIRRVVAEEMQQIGNSWSPFVTEALGRCLAESLAGRPSEEGQATLPGPVWQDAEQWAVAAGLRCAVEMLGGSDERSESSGAGESGTGGAEGTEANDTDAEAEGCSV